MSRFEKFIERFPSKEKFYISLTGKKVSGKVYDHDVKVWNRFEMKMVKDYPLYLKYVLLLADVLEKNRNSSLKIMGYAPIIISVHQLERNASYDKH